MTASRRPLASRRQIAKLCGATCVLLALIATIGSSRAPHWYRDPLRGVGYPDIAELDLNTKPAGQHGFLTVQGPELVFEDGTPARFWGVNIQAYALFKSDRRQIVLHAQRLARLGVNLVRIHHHDSPWVRPNIFQSPQRNTSALSETSLERLDWWIKCLKAEGIYTWLDFHVERQFTERDGIRHFHDASHGQSRAQLKGFNYFNPDIERAMQAFNERLLKHLNPYTGLHYRDEPAIVAGLITNENDLTHHYGNALLENKGVPEHHRMFARRAARAAQTLALDPVRVTKTWEMGAAKIFLNHQEQRFNRAMIRHLRQAGFRAPLATTNSWGRMGLISLPALATGDIIDVHSYAAGNELLRNPREQAGMLDWIGAAQITGRPLSVSEWNMRDFPAFGRHQLPTLLAGVAALQGWDALMLYGYAQQPLGTEPTGNNWTAFPDPEIMALMPAASLLYRQRHISGAHNHYRLRLPQRTFVNENITPENAIAIRTLLERSKLSVDIDYANTFPWLEALQGCKVSTGGPSSCHIVGDKDLDFIPAGQEYTRSDTGELLRDWQRGLHIIDTDKSIVISGRLAANSPLRVGPVLLDIHNASATVALQSLDDKPLRDSEKIFITAVARSRPPEHKGEAYMSEVVRGSITLDVAGNLRARKLGRRVSAAVALVRAAGGNRLVLPERAPTPWILLEKSS